MVTSNIKKFLHVLDPRSEPVVRQAVKKNLPISLLSNPMVQQNQDAAIRPAADQPPETLFQRDGGLRDLIFIKRISPRFPDRLNAGVHDRISGNRERQFIYNNAA